MQLRMLLWVHGVPVTDMQANVLTALASMEEPGEFVGQLI